MTGQRRGTAKPRAVMAAARKALPMRENEDFLPAVIDACHVHGLLVAHFRPMQDARGVWRTPVAGDGKGFPDLVITGPGGVLWRELKSDRGRLSAEQKVWLAALDAAGANVAVWQPEHLTDGTIPGELASLRRPVKTSPRRGPTVVCLCGSTRFEAQFRAAVLAESLAGRIVLAIERWSDLPASVDLGRVTAGLAALHWRRIELADEVLVVSDESGYYGDSTRDEIAHARALGKPVRFTAPAGTPHTEPSTQGSRP